MAAIPSLQRCRAFLSASLPDKCKVWVGLTTALFLLTACSGKWAIDYGEPISRSVSGNWRISQVRVTVPASLTVSEENTYTPNANIVWHGDPVGDRRAQVQAIVYDAARQAVAGMRGGQSAVLDITMEEFHGVTPIAMARAPAAVHNITFIAQVNSAGSGAPLTEPTKIYADLPALVGEAGFYAAQFGPSQKQQVSEHLTAVIQGWLGLGPDIRGQFQSVGR